jgi:hypothetical protein
MNTYTIILLAPNSCFSPLQLITQQCQSRLELPCHGHDSLAVGG